MGKNTKSENQDVVKRLLDTERAARERVDKAREEADGIVEKAKRDAESHVEKVEQKAREEANGIIEEAQNAPPKLPGGERTEDIHSLRRHARENMDRAVNTLVNWVTAEPE